MFRTMKMVQDTEKIRNAAQFKMSSRRVIELATIGGARCLGLDDQIGSLTPGKRADLIMVSLLCAEHVGRTGSREPHRELGSPANVELVAVDGRILKRDGRLTHIDVKRSLQEAAASLKAVRERANWRG